MIQVDIHVTLKKTVSDPQGLTIKHALESLGYSGIQDTRIGKLIVLTLATDDRKQARKDIKQMCKKLLANPIIEDYKFKLKVV